MATKKEVSVKPTGITITHSMIVEITLDELVDILAQRDPAIKTLLDNDKHFEVNDVTADLGAIQIDLLVVD